MADGVTFTLPNGGWRERTYQQPLWDYLNHAPGVKRALAVWHRRAGKDDVALHWAAIAAMTQRVGNYWHAMPEYSQCRKALWTAINPNTGKRRIDEAFPLSLRAVTNESEMFVRFLNGSTWQLVGSDSYNSLVGSSCAGVTFSEYALANPSAWTYIRPILEENNGWALFITTPRGRNHAHALAQYAEHSPYWFYQRLTVHDTQALSAQQLAETKAELMALYGADVGRAQFEQEYECSFNAAILGAFYALEMAQVRAEGRILPVNAVAGRPVHVSWDLGTKHDTALWFFQAVGAQVYILDHYAASGVGVDHFVSVIAERCAEHGWTHGVDYVPHDAKVKEFGTGRTRVETMQLLDLNPMLVPNASVDDGINAVRRLLPLCVFHPRCEERGIAALEQYHREWDDDKKCFKASHVDDWTADTCDSFRYLALAYKPAPRHIPKPAPQPGWRIPPVDEYQRRRARL
jgi:hypothetical protein